MRSYAISVYKKFSTLCVNFGQFRRSTSWNCTPQHPAPSVFLVRMPPLQGSSFWFLWSCPAYFESFAKISSAPRFILSFRAFRLCKAISPRKVAEMDVGRGFPTTHTHTHLHSFGWVLVLSVRLVFGLAIPSSYAIAACPGTSSSSPASSSTKNGNVDCNTIVIPPTMCVLWGSDQGA